MFYLIADTHLGHETLKKSGLRPLDYEEQIFFNWKRLVKNDDTVIHLGDVVEEDNLLMLEKFVTLPGKKILIRGNHDNDSTIEYFQRSSNFCCDELVMTFSSIKILFTHKPKYRHEYDINIHGHLHNININSTTKLFLPIALEYMGYTPIPIDEDFLKKLKNLVDGFWLRNEIPSSNQFKSFGVQPSTCLKDTVIKDTIKNKSELLLRRTKMEFFIDSNFFDNYAMRNKTQQIQKLFLHGKISFEEFKNRIEIVATKNIGDNK